MGVTLVVQTYELLCIPQELFNDSYKLPDMSCTLPQRSKILAAVPGAYPGPAQVSKAVATTDTDVAALQHEEDAASKSPGLPRPAPC